MITTTSVRRESEFFDNRHHANLVAMSAGIRIVLLAWFAGNLAGCATADGGSDRLDREWITAVIVGSAESPDPILVWVEQLEREGKVRDVAVMESYPVQIRLSAPQHVIDELNAAKRKLPPDPL